MTDKLIPGSGRARSESLRARFLSAITETTEPAPARPAPPKAANKRDSIRAVLIDPTRHAVEDITLSTLPTADGVAEDVAPADTHERVTRELVIQVASEAVRSAQLGLAQICELIGCELIGFFPLSDPLANEGLDWCRRKPEPFEFGPDEDEEGQAYSTDWCLYGVAWAAGPPAAYFYFDEHVVGLSTKGKVLVVGYDEETGAVRDVSVTAREIRSVVIWAD
jgi:hypothetical protein